MKNRMMIAASFLAGLSIGTLFFSGTQPLSALSDEFYQEIKLFTEVLTVVRDNYVEEKQMKTLLIDAIKGMVNKLDPFSSYMEPDEAELMKTEAEGEFGGLGIKIAMKDEMLTVITPMPGTPALKAGMLPGDKIVKIEGISTQGLTLSDAVKKLRGAPGTGVTITVAREGKEPFDLAMTRAVIKLESVPPYKVKMLDENVGYIKITEFNEKTPDDFSKAWKKLDEGGMKALVLDLRNNPGGLLKSAVSVCRELLGPNKLIVYTQGRRAGQEMKFYTESDLKHSVIPLVVLINKGSASGSEIVAGAVKDWKRGVLVGEKTFGKASVQSVIPLSDGSSLRLTTAHYYTPKGNLIHEKGIDPDIEVSISREEMIQLFQQDEEVFGLSKEELEKKEKSKIPDRQIDVSLKLLTAEKIFRVPENPD